MIKKLMALAMFISATTAFADPGQLIIHNTTGNNIPLTLTAFPSKGIIPFTLKGNTDITFYAEALPNGTTGFTLTYPVPYPAQGKTQIATSCKGLGEPQAYNKTWAAQKITVGFVNKPTNYEIHSCTISNN